jgi:Ni/Co efflux regulator RcnB
VEYQGHWGRGRAPVVAILALALTLAALGWSTQAETRRPPPPPQRVAQPQRTVVAPRPAPQPVSPGGFAHRQTTFAPSGGFHANGSGLRNVGGSGATRRTFGTTSAPSPSGGRHFGETGQGTGTRHFGEAGSVPGIRHFGGGGVHAAANAPRRVEGGRTYVYRGHSLFAFHADPYRWPRGYHYRRFAEGGVLPRRFWTRDYYLDNYALYDLDPPPPDFEWVRYGPDILLLDLNSGQIAQVVYGAFDDADADEGSADASPDQDQ